MRRDMWNVGNKGYVEAVIAKAWLGSVKFKFNPLLDFSRHQSTKR